MLDKKTKKVSFLALIICCLLASVKVLANEPLLPIPMDIAVDAAKARLGEKLFFDKRLSANDQISCASCHNLTEKGGADLLPKSPGVTGQSGSRNTPTVYNAVLNFTQNWDGSAKDLRQQAEGPITDSIEMGMSEDFQDLIKKLKAVPEYKTAFDENYSGDISKYSITHALAEFQKTLTTPNSPFDKFLKGDQSAISEDAKQGYNKFKQFGCASCHQGANVGGNMFQKFGVHKDTTLRNTDDSDLGRYLITRNQWDKRVFKVPSLRLAVLTPPYFHDGSVKTIEEAVDVMIYYQLGRQVSTEDRNQIIEFLKTLPGDLYEGEK